MTNITFFTALEPAIGSPDCLGVSPCLSHCPRHRPVTWTGSEVIPPRSFCSEPETTWHRVRSHPSKELPVWAGNHVTQGQRSSLQGAPVWAGNHVTQTSACLLSHVLSDSDSRGGRAGAPPRKESEAPFSSPHHKRGAEEQDRGFQVSRLLGSLMWHGGRPSPSIFLSCSCCSGMKRRCPASAHLLADGRPRGPVSRCLPEAARKLARAPRPASSSRCWRQPSAGLCRCILRRNVEIKCRTKIKMVQMKKLKNYLEDIFYLCPENMFCIGGVWGGYE